MFIKSESLDRENVTHGFFGRQGGVSSGIYESLNCGLGTEDHADHVVANREAVSKAIGVDSKNLISLYQIHSDQCVAVTEAWQVEQRPQADAMVTDVPGIALGILTADCVPVLFCGEKAGGEPVVGAAHAGWGGAVKGVLENAISEMEKLGALKETIKAAVGPCIAQSSYEVSVGFEKPFLEQDQANEQFFKTGEPGHLMFDLPGYIVRRLMLADVPEITTSDMDTYFNEMDYFSYRRSVHRKEPDYGRQISAICIKSQ